jgi:hypothetical protein
MLYQKAVGSQELLPDVHQSASLITIIYTAYTAVLLFFLVVICSSAARGRAAYHHQKEQKYRCISSVNDLL